MGVEIERKFLLANDTWRLQILESKNIQQAYLKSDVNSSVRVRIYGEEGYINIKGAAKGNSRAEFEYTIPLQDAKDLLILCESGHIHKVRHKLVWEGHVWEIDEFQAANEGLILAEIELKAENEEFALPHWLGKEVSHETAFTNAVLANKPFNTW